MFVLRQTRVRRPVGATARASSPLLGGLSRTPWAHAIGGHRRPLARERDPPSRPVRADTSLDDRVHILAVDQRQSKQVENRAAGRARARGGPAPAARRAHRQGTTQMGHVEHLPSIGDWCSWRTARRLSGCNPLIPVLRAMGPPSSYEHSEVRLCCRPSRGRPHGSSPPRLIVTPSGPFYNPWPVCLWVGMRHTPYGDRPARARLYSAMLNWQFARRVMPFASRARPSSEDERAGRHAGP